MTSSNPLCQDSRSCTQPPHDADFDLHQIEDCSHGLYDQSDERSSCGVGFITRKDTIQSHDVILKGQEALCSVPHRGGMSSSGVGDGAGISVDLSISFFRKITGKDLKPNEFGVGNFYIPESCSKESIDLIEHNLRSSKLDIIKKRVLPVDNSYISNDAVSLQLPIHQWIFKVSKNISTKLLDSHIHKTLLNIEAVAYADEFFAGLYPLSFSTKLQTLKGRLNSWEIVPYFTDLLDPDHAVHTLYFHTRFSTNTDPHPSMAQPFRLMAHNGELNTDKKNRLNEVAVAKAEDKLIFRPKGQSDSCRLDQTLNSRVYEDNVGLVAAVVAMMPPAWENDTRLSPEVRAMLEYFSLFEEKNDGPAALIFGDGNIIGARLDRLGLRPLRTIETEKYFAVMSEAGQVYFPSNEVLSRGRVEAGGMIYFNHSEGKLYNTNDSLNKLAAEKDYISLVEKSQVGIDSITIPPTDPAKAALRYKGDLSNPARYVAYNHNQETFKFLMDPMLHRGVEKVSAMGYGNAINALSDNEGGVAKYFSQRFAQVTNPPLDSLRESDGMTLRVSLGEKPHFGVSRSMQIVLSSPILRMSDVLRIRSQKKTPCEEFEILYEPDLRDSNANQKRLIEAIDSISIKVSNFAKEHGGIAILTDRHISVSKAAIPSTLAVSAVNQRLIQDGVRLKISLLLESGQIASSHHCACALGFGASAVYPLAVRLRAEELFPKEGEALEAFMRYKKAAEKALLKTMGKIGLCTVESYSGGEFFEPNFLDTSDPTLKKILPNITSPVGGVRFDSIAQSVKDWHQRATQIKSEDQIPILGLFKERSEGAGHSFGTSAVRGFVDMTEESISFTDQEENLDKLKRHTIYELEDAFGMKVSNFSNTSFDKLSEDEIDNFIITSSYRSFSKMMANERLNRPAALRDVLSFPVDFSDAFSYEDFFAKLNINDLVGNNDFKILGLKCNQIGQDQFSLKLVGANLSDSERINNFASALRDSFSPNIKIEVSDKDHVVIVTVSDDPLYFFSRLKPAPQKIALEKVQLASEITPCFTSGAMSHGALVANAHESVAHGVNMVGAMSNSGEGGEHITRYGTIRASRIKQFASGRFGVWAGYLADSELEEIEIKIGQGAKPGEGGQLPAAKVNVEIAAARGGTPGVELVSPPPHHDTYSIEDLGQLIHDAKAARVRVVVKLVSSEGIGTIAVGVAKAGADVINVAGNTGGTGAASVTSLKYTGRAAEIGIAEVHQALCANGLRQKVILRCSGAMQTGSDVVKASLLGGDSFEFGTTALMMLKCVMAKNCNVKCPAGLTTNSEAFDGDPRALAQYMLNVAHEVREILADLGLQSLNHSRGRADLLHLMNHSSSVGQLDLRKMLKIVPEKKVARPIYLEKDFGLDDHWIEKFHNSFLKREEKSLRIVASKPLNNKNKSVGGQFSIDIERLLNHELSSRHSSVIELANGRYRLKNGSIMISTEGSAGQSYGVFCNDGISMNHVGTCNDGVGKGMCGGKIVVLSPPGASKFDGENVLVGNFALFGATGGRLFIEGQAGDRFAVRNSGATAVVEGVGDFCAEYMTNGSILNLGDFSKGFGNGMSGGFAFQYDPKGNLPDMISHDSVLFGTLDDGSENASILHNSAKKMLEWHREATHSVRASVLLDEWENTKKDILWIMPKSLLKYQCADAIFAGVSRKDLEEELSIALVNHQISKLKTAWKSGKPFMNGETPKFGETDTDEIYSLINSYTVLDFAYEISSRYSEIPAKDSDEAARNLVMTEDFALMSSLSKHAKKAISHYDNTELAVLVSNKRVNDFKRSLRLRVTSEMDSLATQAWIEHQDLRNESALEKIPNFEELFAQNSFPEVLERSAND